MFKKFIKGKDTELTGKEIYFAVSEVFKALELPLPDADKVLRLVIEYDEDYNLRISTREFHKIVKDIAGLSKKGKKLYG